MKINKVAAVAGAIAIMGLSLTGCSKKNAAVNASSSQAVQEEVKETAEEAASAEEVQWTADEGLKTLLKDVESPNNFAVLSGIVGGWAPTVMVLDKDGGFYCLVDYAGQATVNFATGTYESNSDGSITATGSLYSTGEELIYEVSKAGDTYTINIEVPDTGSAGEISGKAL